MWLTADSSLQYKIETWPVFMSLYLMNIMSFILLIVGAIAKIEILLLIWLIFSGIRFAFYTTIMILIILVIRLVSTTVAIFALVFCTIGPGLDVYFWVCSYSLYMLLAEVPIRSSLTTGKQIV
jgi:hypothetical protein